MSKRGLAGISIRQPGMAHDLVPVVAGGGVALGTVAGIRKFVDPTTQPQVFVWAPAIGAGASLLAAGLMYAMGGKGPAAAAAVAGVLTGGAVFAADMISAKVVGANAAVSAQYNTPTQAAVQGLANLAAVVPEYSKQIAGILWEKGVSGLGRNEQQSGEKVRLQGVNPTAFGTRSFAS